MRCSPFLKLAFNRKKSSPPPIAQNELTAHWGRYRPIEKHWFIACKQSILQIMVYDFKECSDSKISNN